MADAGFVHIVDDDEAVRDSLAFLFESAGYAVAVYPSAVHLLLASDGLRSGAIVTDMRMPDLTGLEMVRQLRTGGAMHPVVLITGHGDVSLAIEAMRLGVADFIEKPFDDETILSAVARATRDGDEGRGADMGGDALRQRVEDRLQALSRQERAVFDGLAAGKSNGVVAAELGMQLRDVEVARAHVMTKMGASGLSDLVRIALMHETGRGAA